MAEAARWQGTEAAARGRRLIICGGGVWQVGLRRGVLGFNGAMRILRKIGVAVVAGAVVSVGMVAPAAAVGGPYYGAIALSKGTGYIGAGRSADSQSVADGRALMYCRQRGAQDCTIRVRGWGGWLAISTSITGGPWGTGRGQTRQEAVRHAVGFCRYYGGGDACGVGYRLDLT